MTDLRAGPLFTAVTTQYVMYACWQGDGKLTGSTDTLSRPWRTEIVTGTPPRPACWSRSDNNTRENEKNIQLNPDRNWNFVAFACHQAGFLRVRVYGRSDAALLFTKRCQFSFASGRVSGAKRGRSPLRTLCTQKAYESDALTSAERLKLLSFLHKNAGRGCSGVRDQTVQQEPLSQTDV